MDSDGKSCYDREARVEDYMDAWTQWDLIHASLVGLNLEYLGHAVTLSN